MAAGRAHNPEIAQSLDDIADLLELDDANPFRVRAYRNAARVVRSLGKEVSEVLAPDAEALKLPGIGADLADKIRTLAATGHLPLLDQLKKKTPHIAQELLKLPNLGPKRVRTLCEELDVRTFEQLHRAVLDGRVRELPGFGAGIEKKLGEALEAQAKAPPARLKLALAESYVEPLLAYLRAAPGIDKVVVAGSYRRCQETIGDIDILATAESGSPVIERFTAYDEVAKIVASGTTRATVALRSGLQVDLRVVPPESYGSALHYFTGSKAHNIAVRKLAVQRGLKINEYGVFRGKKRIGGKTEEEVFAAVGLTEIPPELREDRGEIEAAAAGKLPDLVELADLRGDLHVHSNATDGHNTLDELAEAADEHGYEYIAITDHSRRLAMAHGLDPRRLRQEMRAHRPRQREAPQRHAPQGDRGRYSRGRNARSAGRGAGRARPRRRGGPQQVQPVAPEADRAHPARDGAAAFHHPRPSDRPAHRRARALRRRYVPDHRGGQGARLLHRAERASRPPRPHRSHCRMAKEAGVLVSIATDAHRAEELSYLRFGVGQGRRGWLEKGDVLNTRSLAKLRPLLARTMRR